MRITDMYSHRGHLAGAAAGGKASACAGKRRKCACAGKGLCGQGLVRPGVHVPASSSPLPPATGFPIIANPRLAAVTVDAPGQALAKPCCKSPAEAAASPRAPAVSNARMRPGGQQAAGGTRLIHTVFIILVGLRVGCLRVQGVKGQGEGGGEGT